MMALARSIVDAVASKGDDGLWDDTTTSRYADMSQGLDLIPKPIGIDHAVAFG